MGPWASSAAETATGTCASSAAAVRFLVERTKGGVKVAIQGRPDTEEVLTDKALKESRYGTNLFAEPDLRAVSREAYACTEKHIGPKHEISDKGGG